MPVSEDDSSPRANVFYVYYAVTDATGKRLASIDGWARPITFCFNGGPGAASVWLHLGGLGPRRVGLPPDGLTPETVVKVVDNPNSILDVTDLVFVDPVSTGLSRAAKGEKPEQFFGVEEDIQAAGEFVRLFTTREQRWPSPKYPLRRKLRRHAGRGAFLLSIAKGRPLSGRGYPDVRPHQFPDHLRRPGQRLPFTVFLPAMTATAQYHNKLAPELAGRSRESRARLAGVRPGRLHGGLEKRRGPIRRRAPQIAEKLAYLPDLPPNRPKSRTCESTPLSSGRCC